jgi:ubiquinone biosynthesis protein
MVAGMIKKRLIPTPLLDPAKTRAMVVADSSAPSGSRAFAIARLLAGWLLASVRLPWRPELDEEQRARRLRVALERLGGLWVKVGQLLSLRTDLLPAALCRELSSLQYQAVGFPGATAREIVEAELGAPLDTVFADFAEAPAAAASIAQVHRARLRREGVWVAVKVQRPGIRKTFDRDMAVIRRIVLACERLALLPALRWRDFLWELEQMLGEEIDYRFEAENLRRMKKTLRRHRVYVPEVFRRHTTSRVLTMEWIDGVLMSDYIAAADADPQRLAAWLAANDINPRRVGRRLYFSCFRQIQEDNLFHADLHPGNIVLLRNSRIALLDFGSVGSLERENLVKYHTFLRSLSTGEYAKAIDFLFLLNHALPDIDLDELKAELIRTLRAWERRTLTKGMLFPEKSQTSLTMSMSRVLYKHRLTPEWYFLKVTRVTNNLDGSLMYLLPDASFSKLLRQYFAAVDRRRLRGALRRKALEGIAVDLVRSAGTIEAAADALLPTSSMLRRKAQVFEGTTSAGADLLAFLFGLAAAACLLAGALLLGALLLRRPLAGARVGPVLSWLAARVAALGALERWAILAGLALLSVSCAKFSRRFARKVYRRSPRAPC